MSHHLRVLTLALAVSVMAAETLAQSLTYSRGQNVAPGYEGWEEDPDGSKHFLFGYMNRNWEEEIDVPAGPGNSFSPGEPDLGQPTHFLPRRNRFVFRVPVPEGFSETDELVWTLTSHGITERAYASLRTDYKLDVVSKMSETGALGAGSSSPEVRANQAPVVTIEGPATRTVKVGQPLTLTAIVTDDGIPKPRGAGLAGVAVNNRGSRRDLAEAAAAAAAANTNSDDAPRVNRAWSPPSRSTVGKNVGLFLSWFVYRGTGDVTYNPPQIKVWEDTRVGARSPWAPVFVVPPMPPDGRVTTTVTFSEPGTYVLRGLADDGGLTSGVNATVTVTR